MKKLFAVLAALALLGIVALAETEEGGATKIVVGDLLTIEIPEVPEIEVPEVPKPTETATPKIEVPEIPDLELPEAADADEAALGQTPLPVAEDAELEAAFEALGEPVYRETYDALRAGEVVQRGSRGETARGVQRTLIALGQKLLADGDFGPKSLAALNAVQAELGLEESDALDAEGYAELVKAIGNRE